MSWAVTTAVAFGLGASSVVAIVCGGLAALSVVVNAGIKRVETRKDWSDYAELRRFFDTTPELLCVASLDGKLIRVNPAWERLLGVGAEEMLGRTFARFLHPDDRHRTAMAIAAVQAGESIDGLINRYRDATGEYRSVEWQAQTVDDVIVAAAWDVTESIGRENQLRQLAQHNSALAEALERCREPILVLDSAGVVLFANHAAIGLSKVLGVAVAPAEPVFILNPSAVRPTTRSEIEKTVALGRPWAGRVVANAHPTTDDLFASPAPQRHLDISLSPIDGAGGPHSARWVVVARDATSAVEEQRATRMRADAAEARARIGELLEQESDIADRMSAAIGALALMEAIGPNVGGAVFTYAASGDLECLASTGLTDQLPAVLSPRSLGDPLSAGEQALLGVIGTSRPVAVPFCTGARCRSNGSEPGAAHGHYLVPLTSGDPSVGVLVLTADVHPTSSPDRLDVLLAIGDMLGTAILRHREAQILLEAQRSSESAKRQVAAIQARLKRAIDGSSDGLWDLDPDSGEMWMSDRFKSLLGYSEADFSEIPHHVDWWAEHTHPRDLEAAIGAMTAHLRGEGPYDVTFRMRRKDGEYRWFSSRGEASRRPDGTPIRVAGSISDIDQQRRADKRFSLAVRAAGIGLWDWEVPTGQAYFNDDWYRMLGYEPGEMPMSFESWSALCRPDDLARAVAKLEAHMRGETPFYESEHPLRSKSGKWVWIRHVGEVVERDENGDPIRVVGVHINVDAEVRAHLEIASLEERLRLFVENTPAAVAMLDRDFRYLVASRGWYEEYGLGSDSIVGQSHYEVFPTVPERWRRDHQRALDGETLRADRDPLVRSDGQTSWVRWQLSPWRDASGHIGGIIMFTEVIDQQIEHEQQMKAALEHAEAASVAKSEFLANLSHEIRTPMNAIVGYANVLESDSPESESPQSVSETATAIRRNANHLLAVINDILDMSKIEAGKLAVERIPTDLAAVVADAVSLLMPLAHDKGLELSWSVETELPDRIWSDPTRVRQILINLLSNAVKFTERGHVRVKLRYVESARRVHICVVDTGIGMNAEQLDRITQFEAFSQADSSTTRRFGGTGLGLRISNSLATLLGGGLQIESEPDGGTSVLVALAAETAPASARPESRDGLHHAATKAGPPGASPRPDSQLLVGRRILVVEDGIDNQRILSFFLRKAGADVHVAGNGRVAIDEYFSNGDGAAIDAILMDIQMPEMDGYEATAWLRSHGVQTPIVALTAHALEGDRERCLAAGCNDYLTKPVDRRQLLRTCAKWVDGAESEGGADDRPDGDGRAAA